jgi:FkbM family methyltransferase
MIEPALKVLRYVWTHPGNRGARSAALLRAVRWQLRKRATGRHLDLPVFGGLTLRCYPDSASASSVIYGGGLPDYNEMTFIKRYLRPGDSFIDVGANIGVYTLLAASVVGPNGSVEAFEPGSGALTRLRENVAINRLGHVRIHPVAASNRAGTIAFETARDTKNRMASGCDGVAGKTDEVQCVTLDSMLHGRRFAMGKIDIEGAEPLALEGASAMLGELNPPVWMLEINGLLEAYGYTEKRLAAWLEERGYRLALFDAGTMTLSPVHEPWKLSSNSIAVAASRWEEVVSRIASAPTGSYA